MMMRDICTKSVFSMKFQIFTLQDYDTEYLLAPGGKFRVSNQYVTSTTRTAVHIHPVIDERERVIALCSVISMTISCCPNLKFEITEGWSILCGAVRSVFRLNIRILGFLQYIGHRIIDSAN